jgi:hypothetical protein
LDIAAILDLINKGEKVEEMGKLLKILSNITSNRLTITSNLTTLLSPILSGAIQVKTKQADPLLSTLLTLIDDQACLSAIAQSGQATLGLVSTLTMYIDSGKTGVS